MKLLHLLILISATSQIKAEDIAGTLTADLLGKWRLDMTPNDLTDNNFAMMQIDRIDGNSMQGLFYREGVKIRNGQINIQPDSIYGALISGDGSGEYNSSFHYHGGIMKGTTHAVNRGFLSIWTASKVGN